MSDNPEGNRSIYNPRQPFATQSRMQLPRIFRLTHTLTISNPGGDCGGVCSEYTIIRSIGHYVYAPAI